MIAKDQRFEGVTVHLDGCTFLNCSFDGCLFVYSGLMKFRLSENALTNSRWDGINSPVHLTPSFLKALCAGGASNLVETIQFSTTVPPRQFLFPRSPAEPTSS